MSAIHDHNDRVRSTEQADALPAIRKITFTDVTAALGKGMSDFWQRPSHYVFLFILYPLLGFVIGIWTSGGNAFQLLYPIATGFALLGPVVALGLYELSRRHETGEDDHPRHAFAVLRSPAMPQILMVGLVLAALFVAWLAAAQAIYGAFYGEGVPPDFWAWMVDVLTTPRGWSLILVGNAVGLIFALAVLATSVVAFPMLVDRGGSAMRAIRTSMRAVRVNPVPMLAWGVIVVGALILGAIPLLVGLAVVLPVLGHATWHLYRAVVAA